MAMAIFQPKSRLVPGLVLVSNEVGRKNHCLAGLRLVNLSVDRRKPTGFPSPKKAQRTPNHPANQPRLGGGAVDIPAEVLALEFEAQGVQEVCVCHGVWLKRFGGTKKLQPNGLDGSFCWMVLFRFKRPKQSFMRDP